NWSDVIMRSWPVASSWSQTCVRSSLSCLEYEIHLPSGDHCGPPMAPVSVDATVSVLPPSTSTRRSLWSDPVHSRELESGDQVMEDLSQSTSLNFCGELPSSWETQTS